MLRTRGVFALIAIVVMAVAVVGCGGSQPPAPTAAPQPAASQPAPAQPAPAPAKPAAPLPKVTMTVAIDALSFGPVYLAEVRDYFRQEGVDVKVVTAASASEALTAVVGKSAEFVATDSSSHLISAEKGVELMAVQTLMNKMTMNFVMRNEVIDRLKIDRKTPIADRFKALKGLTVGITGPGSAVETYSLYYIRQAGLEPQKDVKLATIGGGGGGLIAAMKNGQIDGFHLSPPTPETAEAQGAGKVVIASSMGDVPGLDNYPYEVLLVRKEYLNANRDIVAKVARALARANNFIVNSKDGAFDEMKKHFTKTPPDVLKLATANIAPAVPKDGMTSEAGWQNVLRVAKEAGQLKGDKTNLKEGVLWTNEFVKDVKGKD